jgi:hypothetical protein
MPALEALDQIRRARRGRRRRLGRPLWVAPGGLLRYHPRPVFSGFELSKPATE